MKKPDFMHVDTNSLKLIGKCWGGHGHKWLCHLDHRTPKLAVSHEEINGKTSFFVSRYKFRKA